jgi:hypothetical protein
VYGVEVVELSFIVAIVVKNPAEEIDRHGSMVSERLIDAAEYLASCEMEIRGKIRVRIRFSFASTGPGPERA